MKPSRWSSRLITLPRPSSAALASVSHQNHRELERAIVKCCGWWAIRRRPGCWARRRRSGRRGPRRRGGSGRPAGASGVGHSGRAGRPWSAPSDVTGSLWLGRAKTDRGERALDGIRGPDVLPVFGGEVVEGEQRLPVFHQAGRGLVVLGAVGVDEMVEGGRGRLPGLGHPDAVQVLLGLGLHALGQLVQNVGGLVDPTALLARGPIDLAQRLPEPEVAVADSEFRADLQAAVAQIHQQLAPRLLALAIAVGEPDQFLSAELVRADHDQDALALLIKTSIEVDAIDPEVDVALAGQTAPLP